MRATAPRRAGRHTLPQSPTPPAPFALNTPHPPTPLPPSHPHPPDTPLYEDTRQEETATTGELSTAASSSPPGPSAVAPHMVSTTDLRLWGAVVEWLEGCEQGCIIGGAGRSAACAAVVVLCPARQPRPGGAKEPAPDCPTGPPLVHQGQVAAAELHLVCLALHRPQRLDLGHHANQVHVHLQRAGGGWGV